ncbi:MAG: hypothetical protein A3G49_05710 [Candidatus Sungbacteria bacterium RIFCSPLOWO2_12_FULL_41_11]|uniref:Uncharacterized protein n=1 Tax=Candidatus Sungbacteria bacterium RIFCSPLOWO2_12_FULL_41_11 TaxID=1802286 RepID=A0A1G2LSR2_9BACT|nr:MAG: hypothetical protein A3G49_05710 [Candidatus Sungbacteria bacterium RIFCSPLOWO2_12_FULL_41_11]
MLLYEPAPLSAAETGTPLIRHGGDGATAQRHEGDGKNSALSGKQKGKKRWKEFEISIRRSRS